MRCEPRAEETAGAVSREAPEPSPWGTRVVSLHQQLWRSAGQAKQPGAKRGETGTTTHQKTTGQVHGRRQAGRRAQEEGLRRGLDVQVQVGQEFRHGPAGAYLPCAASPYLQCDARVQPVENDLCRGDVAFARDRFAERAQNGQRVGVRSPIGTPHDWSVGDVLAKKGGQMGAIVFEFGLHPGLGAVSASLRGVRGAYGHVQCSFGIAQGRGEDISGP